MKILIYANIVHTNTLAGGDKIFIECAKRWIKSSHEVTIITNEIGKEYCAKNGISPRHISIWKASWADSWGVYFALSYKALVAILCSLFCKQTEYDIVFASSFFFPDLFPALIAKRSFPNTKLVIASYLFVYKKWGIDYNGGKAKGFLFYLNQIFSLFIVKKYKGKILTASSFDKKYLMDTQNMKENSVLSIRGGVDNTFFSSVPKQTLIYDAVFVGRFHPQKCIAELIDIWAEVVKNLPSAKLALVGNGFLEGALKEQVKVYNLKKNIIFLGQQDGVQKAIILKASKVFVTASRYDSGNIALDEALACGVPGIAYDLPYLHYPQGVIKIPIGSKPVFIRSILSLIQNRELRDRLRVGALEFAQTIDWDITSKSILNFMSQ